jgi:hypothetical protein
MIYALYEISDFKHPKYGLQAFVFLYAFHHLIRIQQRRYGAYLSKQQVADLIAPHLVTLKLVSSWLAHHGVPTPSISTTVTHVGGWLTIYRLPMTKANTASWYNVPALPQQKRTRPSFARFATLPAALTVAPTTNFSSPRAASRQTSELVSNGLMHRNSDLELQNASAAYIKR